MTDYNPETELLELMAERDEMYDEYTEAIADMIGPTVLNALAELFEADLSKIEWSGISHSLREASLRITCTIWYDHADDIPQFVQDLTVEMHGEENENVRILHVGIPIDMVFRPQSELVMFFTKVITGETPSANLIVDNNEFDSSTLTAEQIQQLLVFQHDTLGSKH